MFRSGPIRRTARPIGGARARSLRRTIALGCAGALGYTMAGYPLIMAARARFAPRPTRRDLDARPSVTILVPAHNEVDVIARKLDSLLELDYPQAALDVLVVDDGSTDGTGDAVGAYLASGRIRRLTRQPRQGKMAAINAGIIAAHGELVVLTDASARFDTDALLAAIAPFAAPETGVVSGQNVISGGGGAVEQPAGLYWRYQEKLRAWESASGSTVGVTGNLFVFRRADYRPLPIDTINDEFAIAMDVAGRGKRVLYEPGAVAYDEASSSMGEEMGRRARINAGRYQSLARYCAAVARRPDMLFRLTSHKVLRALLPLFMGGLAATTLLGRVFAGRDRGLAASMERRVLLPGQAVVYGAAAVGALLERLGRPVPRLLAVPFYFVSGNVAAVRGLARFSRGRQSVMWDKRSTIAGDEPSEDVDPGTPVTDQRVLLIDLARKFGGTEARVMHLATTLQQRGTQVVVACLADGMLRSRIEAVGVTTAPISVGRGDPRVALRLARLAREMGATSVDTHGVHSQFWGVPAALAARVPSILVTVHSEYGKEHAGQRRGRFYESVLRVGRGSGAGYLAVSDPVEEYLHEIGIPADRVTMVRNAVPDPDLTGLGDPAELRRELGLPDGAFVLTTVARLHRSKGHRFFIEALAGLRDTLPDIHWLILGEGRERDDLIKRVGQAGLGERVHFLGFRDDVPAVLQATDLFVLPSLAEGLPLVVCEATLQGIPVLATTVGGLPHAYEDGEIRLVPPSDPAALADALVPLVTDDVARSRLARLGQAATRDRLSTELMVDRTVEAYEAAAARRDGARGEAVVAS